MRVAVVGSRGFADLAKVRAVVSQMPRNWIIISGGAPGVDTEAANAAYASGHVVEVYKARVRRS